MLFVSGFRVIGGFQITQFRHMICLSIQFGKECQLSVTLSSDFDLEGRFHELRVEAISYLEQRYTNPMVHSEHQLKHSPWSIIYPFSSKIQQGDMPRLRGWNLTHSGRQ